MEVIERVPRSQRDEAEKRWIKHYRDSGTDLLNHTRGGKGHTGPMSDSAKEKLRIAKRGKPITFADPEGRARRISQALTGIKRSPETREKLARLYRGKRTTPPEKISRIMELFDAGHPRRDIAAMVGVHNGTVGKIVAEEAAKRGQTINPHEQRRLTRERISAGLLNHHNLVSGTGRELTLDELRRREMA